MWKSDKTDLFDVLFILFDVVINSKAIFDVVKKNFSRSSEIRRSDPLPKILFKYTIKYFLIIVENIIHSNLKANKNLHISIKMYFVQCKTSSYSWMIADLPWPFPVPVLPAELSPDRSRVSKRDRTQTIITSSPNEAGKLGHLEVNRQTLNSL